MNIVLDGYGGDNSPYSMIDGAILAEKEISANILITGDEDELKEDSKRTITDDI